MYIFGAIREGGVKIGSLTSGPGAYTGSEVATACTLFQDDERVWFAQLLPHMLQLAAHAVGEEVGNVGAGIVIALPAYSGLTGDVIALARFVESHAHIIGERNWSFALDTFNDTLLQWCHMLYLLPTA